MALDEAHPHLRDHPTALPRFKAVVDTKMPSRRRGKPLFWTHHDYREIENVVLPFARDGETVDLLMIHSVLYEA